jgi:hypothetical protein
MPYHVEILEPVLDYLGSPERGLSVEDLDKLLDFLDGPTGLALVPDAFRIHPANRTAPGAPTFNVKYAFLTSAGQIREFRFVITDTSISYGVLRVDYADEREATT